jgi:hypothetical protein
MWHSQGNPWRARVVACAQVHSGTRLTHGVLGFCFTVVSASHPPHVVDARVEEFIADFAASKCVACVCVCVCACVCSAGTRTGRSEAQALTFTGCLDHGHMTLHKACERRLCGAGKPRVCLCLG